MTSICNRQFIGNVLVVGRTGCGKTQFLEKLGLNKVLVISLKQNGLVALILIKKERSKSNLILVTKQKFRSQKNKMNLIL